MDGSAIFKGFIRFDPTCERKRHSLSEETEVSKKRKMNNRLSESLVLPPTSNAGHEDRLERHLDNQGISKVGESERDEILEEFESRGMEEEDNDARTQEIEDGLENRIKKKKKKKKKNRDEEDSDHDAISHKNDKKGYKVTHLTIKGNEADNEEDKRLKRKKEKKKVKNDTADEVSFREEDEQIMDDHYDGVSKESQLKMVETGFSTNDNVRKKKKKKKEKDYSSVEKVANSEDQESDEKELFVEAEDRLSAFGETKVNSDEDVSKELLVDQHVKEMCEELAANFAFNFDLEEVKQDEVEDIKEEETESDDDHSRSLQSSKTPAPRRFFLDVDSLPETDFFKQRPSMEEMKEKWANQRAFVRDIVYRANKMAVWKAKEKRKK